MIEHFLEQIRQRVAELEPRQARERQLDGALLLDVREAEEIAHGGPEGAYSVGRGFLEPRVADLCARSDQQLVLICGGGQRSLIAADTLQRMGYTNVASVAGGFSAWRQAGLPEADAAVAGELDGDARERYARHLSLPEIGVTGQTRLLQSRVLVVGAGGLGCPASMYLAAAGVGTITIVDPDRVELSNLQRQILHGTAHTGELKVDTARLRLRELNPSIDVRTRALRVDADNAGDLVAGHDVVVDGSDNFAARYAVNDACVRAGRPLVYGAVEGFSGQVAVFAPHLAGGRGSGCYRCLFPAPGQGPSCAEAGVLGAVPGVIGLLQATETIKLLLDLGQPLMGRLLRYDALGTRTAESRLKADPDCAVCAAMSVAKDPAGAG